MRRSTAAFAFPGHDCQTAEFAGFAGLKNGPLISAAESAGFEVLITVDQHIPYQQNLIGRKLAVLNLRAPTNRLRDLMPLLPETMAALGSIQE